MYKNIRDLIEEWPKCFIKDIDLVMLLNRTDDARYSIIKRSIKSGLLIRIKRGLYLIKSKTKQFLPDEFELALLIYGPSFISLESALSYHGLIPETVYTITCVSTKRAKEFKTPIGLFSYKHVPAERFYTGVDRITKKNGIIFVATPWRSIADFIYTRRKNWKSLIELEQDLRIDIDSLVDYDKKTLKLLIESYPSCRVRDNLTRFSKEIIEIL
ncbi:hypothetical protein ACFLYH_03360 [Candidatus Dependentiae bacterium]